MWTPLCKWGGQAGRYIRRRKFERGQRAVLLGACMPTPYSVSFSDSDFKGDSCRDRIIHTGLCVFHIFRGGSSSDSEFRVAMYAVR